MSSERKIWNFFDFFWIISQFNQNINCERYKQIHCSFDLFAVCISFSRISLKEIMNDTLSVKPQPDSLDNKVNWFQVIKHSKLSQNEYCTAYNQIWVRQQFQPIKVQLWQKETNNKAENWHTCSPTLYLIQYILRIHQQFMLKPGEGRKYIRLL